MQVRTPQWDFSKVRAHWAPNREFAQNWNATSTVPAYIEPYLVKVLRKAYPLLADMPPAQLREVDIFIKQEMQHCKQHIAFNNAFRAQGYEGMLPLEQAYAADYDRFLASKSLQFNLAYCEGFEAISSLGTQAFFEDFDAFFEGADPEAIELWRWHLAEEHEHREVMHNVYHHIYGRRPVQAYLYRIFGLFCAARHIGRHTGRVSAYLLAKDREGMSAAELGQSQARAKQLGAASGRGALGLIRSILSPRYNPRDRRTPRGVEECLARHAAPVKAA